MVLVRRLSPSSLKPAGDMGNPPMLTDTSCTIGVLYFFKKKRKKERKERGREREREKKTRRKRRRKRIMIMATAMTMMTGGEQE